MPEIETETKAGTETDTKAETETKTEAETEAKTETKTETKAETENETSPNSGEKETPAAQNKTTPAFADNRTKPVPIPILNPKPPKIKKGLFNAAFNGTQSNKPEEKVSYTDDFTELEELIKNNVDYDYWKNHKKTFVEQVDEIILIIMDAVLTKDRFIRINSEFKPRAMVRSVLMKLDMIDIDHVISQFQKQRNRISKKKDYILTMLYNTKLELNSHYVNAVSADGFF